ncbi:eukaryotic release factor 3, putative [Trypanosoma equiperdum]|uniref:Eukaryotic release factor 3, putative n=3 Tax=Trypanozoon TaxID=39700 RepID=Q385F3_TRYB2|nr:eukaryotic release factor 3, putative [Trypanosoma brucei brucei TREU927]EAN79578.1 eukaryotic release factor 3, putative [Trypanosoma brucei brucei TREU927]SCU64270.1 eukaryotic release factor 3, putative [Trypanosoma equiperdum]
MSGWAQPGGFNPNANAFTPSHPQGQYPQQHQGHAGGAPQQGYYYQSPYQQQQQAVYNPAFVSQQGGYNPSYQQQGGYVPGYNHQMGGYNQGYGGQQGGYTPVYNQQRGGYNAVHNQQRFQSQQYDRAGQGTGQGGAPTQGYVNPPQQVEPEEQPKTSSAQTSKLSLGGGASEFVPPAKKAKAGTLSLSKKKVEETKPKEGNAKSDSQPKDNAGNTTTTTADDKKGSAKLTPEELREQVRCEIAKQREQNKKEFVRDPRPHFNIVFCGHVDAGKSTISGHLLMEKGLVDQREMEKLRREAEVHHREGWEYAYVMDVSEDERTKGITRETGAAYVETEKRRITVLDAPGHKAFVPSMIGGATQADVCVLVISSRTGEFETGFEKGGQTREHAMLVRTCGVKQMICVINKMDEVNWSKERYDAILGKLKPFLRQNGYDEEKAKNLIFIPIAGLTGDNLIRETAEGVCPWYKGPTMMSFIDELVLPETKSENDVLCIPLVGSYKDEGRVFVYGKVESGSVAVGEKIQILPSKQEAVVEGISIEATEFEKCYPGDNVHLRVRGVDEGDVHAGYVGTSVPTSLRAVEYFQARVVILDVKNIICAGSRVMLHAHAAQEEVSFHKLLAKVDKKTGEVVQKDPTHVKAGDVVIARMELERALVLEPHKDFDKMGRFMLREDGKTIAIGLVMKLYESTRESLANAGKA